MTDNPYFKPALVRALRDLAEELRRPREEQRSGDVFDRLADIVDAFFPDVITDGSLSSVKIPSDADRIVAYLRESAERGWGSSGALPSRETLLLAASFIEAGRHLDTKVEG
jgi:hypothetical protein